MRMTAASLIVFGLMGAASAARNASSEVGRWIGFGHQAEVTGDGSVTVMDLVPSTAAGELAHLDGTLSGLPAVQRTFTVSGAVTPGGQLHLNLRADGYTGFCDGSVRNLSGFTGETEPDAIGDINYRVTDTAGHVLRGHINMIHLYGGRAWADVAAPHFGQGSGAYLRARTNVAGHSAASVLTQQGSQMGGTLALGDYQFQMLGTGNAHGSLIFLCDGSVRQGDNHSLIGLLFTGGVAQPVAGDQQSVVGFFGVGSFGLLLPAVQKVRESALSFSFPVVGG